MTNHKHDLGKLAAAIEGRVVEPSTPDFERARKLWNSRFDDIRPHAIVQVAGAEDIRRVVGFAREHDLRVVARNGGHSFAGHSTGDGIVVDVSQLSSVEVSTDRSRARLGAGSTVLPTYQALWPHRLAIPAGTCPTVGITGLTSVGGLGVLGRLHGLTCDSLIGVELVGAGGELLQADEEQNADLFWALRGGGGGNFGIVVSQTFRLVPVDMPFTHSTVEFPWEAAGRVVSAWQEWAHSAPRELWSAAVLETQAPGAGAGALIEAVYAGDPGNVVPLVDELSAAVGVEPTLKSSTSEFVSVPSDFYCKGLRPQECHTEDLFPGGKMPRSAYYAKSDVASSPWPSAGIETLVEWIAARQRDALLTPPDFDPHTDTGKVLIEIADGAVRSIAPDATAFVHRDSLFVSQYAARWRKGVPEETAEANVAWAKGLYSAVEPYRSGSAYLGYIDPDLLDWEQAYYGANLKRLRAVKAEYDPDNCFRFAQSIRPDEPQTL